jgi:uncharacterized LabA/DUF88 family protein
MIRVLVLVDESNLEGQLRADNRRPDHLSLRRFIADPDEGRFLIDMVIYAALPHENGEKVVKWHDWLRMQGFSVISKRAKKLPNGTTKCNLDTELALDALEMAAEIRPDVVVLVTGDGDFSIVCRRLRRKGIRVEVASLNRGLANELKAAASGVIDLSDWAATCQAMGGQDAPAIGTAAVFDELI